MSVRISDSNLNVFNPVTGKDISSIPMTTLTEMQTILDNAEIASKTYNFSTFSQRQKLMYQFRKGIVKYMDEFIDTITAETGKKEVESLMEIFISLEHLQQSSKNLYTALEKRYRRVGIMKMKKAWIEYESMGVAGIISPWNYPLILTMSPTVEAMLAGNTVVLKSSEHTPLTTKLLKKVWDESTGKTELFQVVYGAEEIGSTLVNSDKTNIICFTGSTAVGQKIAESCAPIFKPVILELGGKDPMIIMEDADLDRSVDAALWGGLSNAGQTCISVEHIYAHESIYPALIDKLSNAIKNISAGIGDKHLGSISVDAIRKKITNYILEVEKRAQIIQGTADKGWFIPPTLVINPPLESEMIKKEIFGPVITIHPFKDDEEAIKFANLTGYGLSASIFGKDYSRIYYISRKIKTGTVSINDVLTHYGIADLPFGGMGLSGIGKVHGKEGLRAFSHQKSYLKNRISLKSELWWFRNRERLGNILKKWIKWRFS